jgi:GT2 family glycosyltransferase
MIENLIVPVLNRYDLLARMLASVDYKIKNLLVIDNGASIMPEPLVIEPNTNFAKITHLKMPANLGVGGSWNLGIKSFPYAKRWFIASNDIVFEPGALEAMSWAKADEITLCGDAPHWQAFALGDQAVKKIGLFDECGFFPAYFEDNDYLRRAEKQEVNVRMIDINVRHENSSTIKSGFMEKNAKTFAANQAYHHSKIANNDFSSGSWSLQRRRENGWE